MSGIVYPTAADHLNKAHYLAHVPAFYSPILPDAYINPIPENDYALGIPGVKAVNTHPPQRLHPIYEPLHSLARTRSQVTIAQMVDMFNTKVPFEIINPKDVVAVFHSLDSYLLEIRKDIEEKNKDYMNYGKKVIEFRQTLYRKFMAILNRNPTWKDLYQKDSERDRLVFFHLSAIHGLKGDNILEKLKNPPYTIDDPHLSTSNPFLSPSLPPRDELGYRQNTDMYGNNT